MYLSPGRHVEAWLVDVLPWKHPLVCCHLQCALGVAELLPLAWHHFTVGGPQEHGIMGPQKPGDKHTACHVS